MTRRYALLLSLSGPVAAQTCSADQISECHEQNRTHPTTGRAQDPLLRWNPCPAFVGGPILFQSKTFSGTAIWLGKQIKFRPDGDFFSALAGVDLDRIHGHYPLVVGGKTVQVTVKDHTYPSSRVTVPQKFVKPPREVQAQIEEEIRIKRQVFKSSAGERLWHGPFVAPAKARYTSSFGSRRIYNGKILSVHQGLDYSALVGTGVTAANSGHVAIAGNFYFEGGFIVIDHGESIFTLYMHLSELLVNQGTFINKGATIAKSGSSGRVTGAHLHFAMQ